MNTEEESPHCTADPTILHVRHLHHRVGVVVGLHVVQPDQARHVLRAVQRAHPPPVPIQLCHLHVTVGCTGRVTGAPAGLRSKQARMQYQVALAFNACSSSYLHACNKAEAYLRDAG